MVPLAAQRFHAEAREENSAHIPAPAVPRAAAPGAGGPYHVERAHRTEQRRQRRRLVHQAILTANADTSPDTITFADGLEGTITLTSGELLITNSVTINGPGANVLAVSGNNASRVFDMTPGLNVAISGLTVTDGYALEEAGGILNQGSNLTLSADVLTQNVAFGSASTGGRGGALRSLDGLLTITDCTITDNQAPGGTSTTEGFAIGGGIYILAGSATISNSTFSDNSTVGENGVTATATTFAGQAEGGTLFASASAASMTITASTFSDNSAVGGDGGTGGQAGEAFAGRRRLHSLPQHQRQHLQRQLRCRRRWRHRDIRWQRLWRPVVCNAFASISAGTFSDNCAVGGDGDTGALAGFGFGGAIDINGPSASISGSTFDHNQAIGGSGGNSGPGQQDPVVDGAQGGAICNADGPGVTMIVTSSSFSHNLAMGGNNATATGTYQAWAGTALGGAVDNEGETATISGSTFDHNQAIGGYGNSGSTRWYLSAQAWDAPLDNGYGGVMSNTIIGPSTATVSFCSLDHNKAVGGDNNTGTASVAGLVGAGVGVVVANGSEVQPTSAAASWTTARPWAAPATRPAAPGRSSPVSARAAASSITWGITTPPATGS